MSDAHWTILWQFDYLPYGEKSINPGLAVANSNETDYLYGGKELPKFFVNKWYDSIARYQTTSGVFSSPDPLAEKYYSLSPYAYCAGNPVKFVDPDGKDWYENNETHSYTWFDRNDEIEGYTYYGPKGSLLGEFENMINDFMIEMDINEGLFQDGFTFSIRESDIGVFSNDEQVGLFQEFVTNTGPEYSVFLPSHPMTNELLNEPTVLSAENELRNGATSVKTYRKWTVKDIPKNSSLTKQFIGSYSYRGKAGRELIYNMVFDSKSRHSLFLHIPANNNREHSKYFGNTYQFYLSISFK